MKRILIFCLVIFSTATIINAKKRGRKISPANVKIIVIDNWPAGLFSNVFSVINDLIWADKNNITPIVHWGVKSKYYQREGYNGSFEPWEYYFEPVSSIKYEDVIGKPGTLVRRNYEAPDRTHMPTTVCKKRGYKKTLTRDYRHSIKRIIDKYITVKPIVMEKIDSFYFEKISGKKTIGLHLRGTDKGREAVPVTIKEICLEANTMADTMNADQFFIATDDTRLLTKAHKLLKRPIITYDSFRGSGKKGIHKMNPNVYSKAKMGEEVLIEVLLLSRCDAFIHTRSNVSSAVLFFNPDLESKVLYNKKKCPLRTFNFHEPDYPLLAE